MFKSGIGIWKMHPQHHSYSNMLNKMTLQLVVIGDTASEGKVYGIRNLSHFNSYL